MQNLLMICAVCVAGLPVFAQEPEPPMTMARLGQILLALDLEGKATGTAMKFSIEGIPVIVIVNPVVDRIGAMRKWCANPRILWYIWRSDPRLRRPQNDWIPDGGCG